MVGTAVVGGGVALAKVVALSLVRVAANPLPVNLVEVSGLKDSAGDDALADGGLAFDVDAAEEDVLVGGDSGGVGLLLDGEDGALFVVLEASAGELLEGAAGALGEVASDDAAEGRVGGAG
jgi:hypothetical protein